MKVKNYSETVMSIRTERIEIMMRLRKTSEPMKKAILDRHHHGHEIWQVAARYGVSTMGVNKTENWIVKTEMELQEVYCGQDSVQSRMASD